MIHPSVDELLTGAIQIYEESILPELEDDFVRGKGTALVNILQRVRAQWSRIGCYLYEDNEDIEATLRELLKVDAPNEALGSRVEQVGLSAMVVATLQNSPSGSVAYPSPTALADRNRELKQALVALVSADPGELEASLGGGSDRARAMLRALCQRMVERDLALSSAS